MFKVELVKILPFGIMLPSVYYFVPNKHAANVVCKHKYISLLSFMLLPATCSEFFCYKIFLSAYISLKLLYNALFCYYYLAQTLCLANNNLSNMNHDKETIRNL